MKERRNRRGERDEPIMTTDVTQQEKVVLGNRKDA